MTHFAAGCSTSSIRRIVAPSFVTVTSPTSSTSILSKPTGPRELLTMFAIDDAAITGIEEISNYEFVDMKPRFWKFCIKLQFSSHEIMLKVMF